MMANQISSQALQSLAQFYGIQYSYVDDFGKRKNIDRDVLLAILSAMNCPINAAGQAEQCLVQDKLDHYRRIVEPVIVIWQNHEACINLYVARDRLSRPLDVFLTMEDGTPKQWRIIPDHLATKEHKQAGGQVFEQKTLPLRSLPFGYHSLRVAQGSHETHAMVIVAPKHIEGQAGTNKRWGPFMPLYGIKSQRNFGIGDFTDLDRLIQWQAGYGGSMLGTLPIYANFLQKPFDPSPYSPITRLCFNEIYLDIEAVPEFQMCQTAQKEYAKYQESGELAQLCQSGQVQYQRVYAVKRHLLAVLADYFFEHGSSERYQAFRQFIEAWPEVDAYARFRAYQEDHPTSWYSWPDSDLTMAATEPANREAYRFHLYCQWQIHEQLQIINQTCREHDTHLYLDMPVGTHPDGFDTFYYARSFVSNMAIGAPPDRVFVRGQNWGVAPLHPFRIRYQQYHYFIKCLRAIMPHISMLRIDHIMQFHRLFWIPQGFSAKEGAFVRYNADEFYAVLSLEAYRHGVDIIGENLGTVTQQVNRKMTEHQLKRMYVVQYELDSHAQPDHYRVPRDVMASLNTHDMPTFYGYCLGVDLKRRQKHGILTGKDAVEVYHERKQTLKHLARFLFDEGYMEDWPVRIYSLIKACLYFLAASKCRYMLVNFEDLWQETEQQNVPGTLDEYPNWRNKMRFALEELTELANFNKEIGVIDDYRREGRRDDS